MNAKAVVNTAYLLLCIQMQVRWWRMPPPPHPRSASWTRPTPSGWLLFELGVPPRVASPAMDDEDPVSDKGYKGAVSISSVRSYNEEICTGAIRFVDRSLPCHIVHQPSSPLAVVSTARIIS
jgi:hypothetical protein